jgi:hypothetical protein
VGEVIQRGILRRSIYEICFAINIEEAYKYNKRSIKLKINEEGKEKGIHKEGKIFKKGENMGHLEGKRKKLKGERHNKIEKMDVTKARIGGFEIRGMR